MKTSPTFSVLLIDIDLKIAEILRESAATFELQPLLHATSLKEGLKTNRETNCDIIFMRDTMSDGTALYALQNLISQTHSPEIIIYTTQGDLEQAESALKNGAWDYVIDPFPEKLLSNLLERAVRYRHEKLDNGLSEEQIRDDFSNHGIIGNSPTINNCLNQAVKISQSKANVLITGESGTGKELFARAIHNFSDRSDRELVVVDCAALPSTLVESILFGHSKGSFTGADKANQGLVKRADKGTLFLDEIGEMSLEIQKKMLRVIQERKYRPVGSNVEIKSDFRLISATNKDLQNMVVEGKFREDLYFRLKTFHLELPPLRNRTADITQLSYHFRDSFCKQNKMKKIKISADYLTKLSQYEWPGNVRELLHAIERSLTAAQPSRILYANHLPISIRLNVTKKKLEKIHEKKAPFKSKPAQTQILQFDPENMPTINEVRDMVIQAEEKRYLQYLVSCHGGNIKKCCAISGLSRSRFYELLKIHQISR